MSIDYISFLHILNEKCDIRIMEELIMEKVPALLITIFLGEFGVHRFMAGKIGTGIIWLLTAGCFGIGYIVDIIQVATGKFTKKDGTPWVTE